MGDNPNEEQFLLLVQHEATALRLQELLSSANVRRCPTAVQ